MRAILFVLLITMTTCYGQDREAKALIYSVFGKDTKLVYTDRFPEFLIGDMRSSLNEDTLYASGLSHYDPTKLLILSRQEKLYVNEELNKMGTLVWSNVFENGFLLKTDSSGNILKTNPSSSNQPRPSNIESKKIYHFSRPIFIRNHTLCFFCFGYYCGARCGQGELAVFRKENGSWIPWMRLFTWVS